MHHSNWMLALAILAAGCARATARENDTPAEATAVAAAPQPKRPVDPKLLAGPRCRAHGAIESLCTKCNPKLEPVFRAKGDWCAEHEFPESICPICHPELAEKAPAEGSDRPSSSVAPGTVIRFKSPALEQAAGITFTDAARAAFESGVSAVARIEFDPNRVADVRAPVAGLVKEIHVELGSAVKRGTVLFTLTSVEVGQLQGQLRASRQRVLTARASLERETKLERAGIGARVNVERADRALAEAQAETEA
ncbi:MAG: efflux RND transporter periplasmic adaptor subunit, partial [Polyangiaceae bacterium]